MKQFVIKAIRYLLIIILLLGCIIYIFISRKPEFFLGPSTDYFQCTYQYDQINKKAGFSNIIIGDSRGNAGINPRLLGEKWINLSIPGSDLLEGYITFKRYLLNNKIDTVVMVYGMNYIGEHSRWFNLRTIPFRFINYSELDSLEQVERKFNYLFHGQSTGRFKLQYDQWVRKLKYWHSPFSYRETFLDGLNNFCFSRAEVNAGKERIFKQLSEYRGYTNFGTADSNNTDNINGDFHFRPGPINMHYLKLIMHLASENKIAVFFINPPINQASFKTYNRSVYESTINQSLEELQKKYPELCVLPTPVWMPNTMFGDPYHLNKNGTTQFSAIARRHLNTE